MSHSECKCICGELVIVDYADGMCTICCIKKLKAQLADLQAPAPRPGPVCKECESWSGECTSSVPCDMNFSAFKVKQAPQGDFTGRMKKKYVVRGVEDLFEACDRLDRQDKELEKAKSERNWYGYYMHEKKENKRLKQQIENAQKALEKLCGQVDGASYGLLYEQIFGKGK